MGPFLDPCDQCPEREDCNHDPERSQDSTGHHQKSAAFQRITALTLVETPRLAALTKRRSDFKGMVTRALARTLRPRAELTFKSEPMPLFLRRRPRIFRRRRGPE